MAKKKKMTEAEKQALVKAAEKELYKPKAENDCMAPASDRGFGIYVTEPLLKDLKVELVKGKGSISTKGDEVVSIKASSEKPKVTKTKKDTEQNNQGMEI